VTCRPYLCAGGATAGTVVAVVLSLTACGQTVTTGGLHLGQPRMLWSKVHRELVTASAVAGQGTTVLDGTSAGNLYAVPPTGVATNQRPIARLSGKIIAVGLSRDGHMGAGASVSGDIAVGAIDGKMLTGRLEITPESVAFNRTGTQVAFGGSGVTVFDASTGATLGNYRQPLSPLGRDTYQDVAFAPDHRMVAAAYDGVDQWKVGQSRVTVPTVVCDCAPDGVALSGDGRFAIFGTADGHMTITEVASGRVIADRTVSTNLEDHVFAVAASSTGDAFAAFAASGAGLIWERHTHRVAWRGKLARLFPSHVSFVGHRALLIGSRTNESDAGTGFGLAPWLVPLSP
jgi:hypothetical protein